MQMSERGQRMSVNQEIPSFAIELSCTRLLYFAEFNVSAHERKCFWLHKCFLLSSDDKDILTLKTMAPYSYCFCIVCWKCENS